MKIVHGGKKRQILPGSFLLLFFLLSLPVFSQEVPRWVTQRALVYPPEMYIVGAGEGRSLEEAQERAITQISLFFKTSVSDTRQLLHSYREVMSGSVSEQFSLSQNSIIRSEAEFFGVEFAPHYIDKNRVVHALAYIDREEVATIYDRRIQYNADVANSLFRQHGNSPNPFAALGKLRRARSIAGLALEYVDMALLVQSGNSSRYTFVQTLALQLDRAIENCRARMTAAITLNEEGVRPLALKLAEILRGEGFLIVDSGGEYTAAIYVQLNEGKTQNYYTVKPLVDINLKLQGGDALVRFQKEYAIFRHLTQEEALGRALRNIEQDLGGTFSAELRRLEE